MIRIDSPENIYAVFMMKNDSPDEIYSIDSMPGVSPSQVHGDNIIHIHDDNAMSLSLPQRPEADGVLLTTTKVSASIRVADCAPVMICNEHWVMILHSGFKGTVLNISQKGLELVKRVFGDDAVSQAYAWIGPCIGRDDYERDLNEEWSIRGMNVFHHENYDVQCKKVYFDLAGEIKSQLIECGFDEKNITMTGINTYRTPECCSYRHGDIHERMTLYVRLRGFHQ